MKSCRSILTIFVLGALLAAQSVIADERILSYMSDIEVHEDGSMVVTETIRVRAEGRKIKRGIYRDFPTRYRTKSGDDYVVDFELYDVSRDGKNEPHHTESLSNGVRIYIGHKNVLLKPGEYSYKISYRTDRQLGFFKEYDELYWNVTGTDWAFPINAVVTRITLPAGIPSHRISTEGYTGLYGEYGKDFRAGINALGQVEFAATRALRPREGLSVAVAWPKGYVTEPSMQEKLGYFLRDNSYALVAIVGIMILLMYYYLAWRKVGRDPASGTIVPIFQPPENLSPAAMRYIYRMGFDNKAYSAAIINMAVKGYLTIEDEDDTYTVRRVDGADETVLSPGEKSVLQHLLRGKQSATFKRKHNASIRKSIKALKGLLKKEYHSTQFHTNSWYLIPGVVLSILILVVSGFSYSGETAFALLMLSLWLTGWSFTIFILIRQRQLLMAVIFSVFEIGALSFFFQLGSWSLLALLAALIGLNILFYYLIRAPTDTGRKLLDKIEGFRLYLATAEEDRLNALNPPEQTPALFEKYLPYALALGVDQAWSERFAAKVARESQDPKGSGYRPDWYSGSNWDSFNPTGFSSSLGSSLSKAVASSSTTPGSSSGSSGGGFSGGGGGGGGGGGW
ncbi:MAG: DUF2207 domain-containing protein [Arenicellales bacterium]|nr:DUF2207 domain-containing protein [Arenicellales bacterium]